MSQEELLDHVEQTHLSRVSLPCPFKDCNLLFSRHPLLSNHLLDFHRNIAYQTVDQSYEELHPSANPEGSGSGVVLDELPTSDLPVVFSTTSLSIHPSSVSHHHSAHGLGLTPSDWHHYAPRLQLASTTPSPANALRGKEDNDVDCSMVFVNLNSRFRRNGEREEFGSSTILVVPTSPDILEPSNDHTSASQQLSIPVPPKVLQLPVRDHAPDSIGFAVLEALYNELPRVDGKLVTSTDMNTDKD
ncbi:hypothetical protein EW145_g5986 [Phellinidium pouzarii]|uniref:C2H2-type domain-containing protein n=1 Tax=Phellinidium pouzarii TaxID=167371 RepID=A0A4S4KY34_9AGAM|nr:hypothetical protein EW145_g5986 [Phellinidium pouzarii]